MQKLEQYHELIPEVFLFVDRKCFPDWVIEKHTIDFHDLTFVLEGKAYYYINNKKVQVEAGDIIYIPEGSLREAHTTESSPMHSFAFNFVWRSPHNQVHLPLPLVSKGLLSNEIRNHIKEFNQVWMSKLPGYLMHARGIFQIIIYKLLTHSLDDQAPYDARVNKVRSYIVDHYGEEIDLGIAASLVDLHPVYLGKLFKQNTGLSIREYLNMIRVNNAEMMLSTGGFTVSEVALRCGYKDISYFSNVFKSYKGYPPSAVVKS